MLAPTLLPGFGLTHTIDRIVRVGLWVLVITAAVTINHKLSEWTELLPLRYLAHKHLFSEQSGPRAKSVVVLRLQDEDYYKEGEFQQRRMSDDIGKMAERLARHYRPSTIAVDIELETVDDASNSALQTMVERISKACAKGETEPGCALVMPERLTYQMESDGVTRKWRRVRTKLHESVQSAKSEPGSALHKHQNVYFGFVNIAEDVRVLPWTTPLVSDQGEPDYANSFAMVAAHTHKRNLGIFTRHFHEYPVAKLWPESMIDIVTPQELMQSERDPNLAQLIDGRIVVIGAGWHAEARNGGPLNDAARPSPVGEISGFLIQAGYIESIVTEAFVYDKPSKPLLIVLESISLLLLAAGTFALRQIPLLQDREPLWSVTAAMGLTVIWIVLVSLVFKQSGLYYDVIVPIVIVWIHGVLDDYRETKIENRHLRSKLGEATVSDSQPASA